MNTAVVYANRGFMPVCLEGFDNLTKHFVVDPARVKFSCSLYKFADRNTRLYQLCDRFARLPLLPEGGLWSVGDAFVVYGIAYLLATAILRILWRVFF